MHRLKFKLCSGFEDIHFDFYVCQNFIENIPERKLLIIYDERSVQFSENLEYSWSAKGKTVI